MRRKKVMNKEIMEIVEIKNEIEDLKKLNAEENEKIKGFGLQV